MLQFSFPNIDFEGTDIVSIFEHDTEIMPVDWIYYVEPKYFAQSVNGETAHEGALGLAGYYFVPSAMAVTHCDVNPRGFLISEFMAGWVGVERTALSMLHEFMHLLDCSRIWENYGTQDEMPIEAHLECEERAALISLTCYGLDTDKQEKGATE